MKNLVLCITLNFLFFINIVYSVDIVPEKKLVNFQAKSQIILTCNVSYEGEEKPTIEWLKDSKKVVDVDNLKDRANQKWKGTKQYILTVDKSTDSDSGNYTCIAYQGNDEKARANITVTKTIFVKVPSNINVVEEERLRIECQVVGDAVLYWIFHNEMYDVSRNRVVLESYTDENRVIKNGVFIVENITGDDRGYVTCVGEDLASNQSSQDKCMVRVKGKYAALWPFLGICAEVIVLCAIIVIYEKKRNKTELEESDTDQSPDQKNTPDHGKEANLRHRQ